MDDPSRIPPIASERRRCALTNTSRGRGRGCGWGSGRDDDIVLEEARQILEEDVIDNGLGDDDDAADVDQAEEVLTSPFPGGPSDPSVLKSFKAHIAAAIWEQKLSGLSSLVHCTYRFVNRIVIAAFVEQWQPETNTFHLTVGEMMMTLDDVGTILGIPITGRSVSAATLTDQQAHALVVDALGVDDAKATEELSSARGQSVKLEWLRTKFSGCKDSDTEESIACATRAYLLFLLGFALAYLYRQLGFATRSAVRQMASYMRLLEAWIYEHFRPFRPHQNMEYTVQLPHVHRWTPRREAGSTISHLQALREELDRLAFDKCLDVVELHYPERILRQFGRVQTILPAPLDPVRAVRGVTAGRYTVMYQYLDQIWESWDNHVLSARRRSTPWYTTITHLHIQNPTHRSGFNPRAQDSRFDMQDAERIDHALQIAHPIIEAGHDASAIERMTRVLQGQQIDEAGPSSIPLRTYNRRRRVDDR
ncbi:hypothetical protein CsSME_00042234 [Camellia sinensis var. sinensis]